MPEFQIATSGEETSTVAAVIGTKGRARPAVSQAQKLRDALEDDIVNGALTPGDRLDEAALAERFNVSRTPIREAFKSLVGSGLTSFALGVWVFERSGSATLFALIGLCAVLPRILLVAETAGRREALNELLRDNQQHARACDSWHTFINDSEHLCITVAAIAHGLLLQEPAISVITRPMPESMPISPLERLLSLVPPLATWMSPASRS